MTEFLDEQPPDDESAHWGMEITDAQQQALLDFTAGMIGSVQGLAELRLARYPVPSEPDAFGRERTYGEVALNLCAQVETTTRYKPEPGVGVEIFYRRNHHDQKGRSVRVEVMRAAANGAQPTLSWYTAADTGAAASGVYDFEQGVATGPAVTATHDRLTSVGAKQLQVLDNVRTAPGFVFTQLNLHDVYTQLGNCHEDDMVKDRWLPHFPNVGGLG